MSDSLSADACSAEERVAEVVDEFMARVGRGERPDVDEYVRRHPELADVLRQVLPAVQLIRPGGGGGPPSPPGPDAPLVGGELGDFRIVREVGRGGMGIVYEAEQVSLRRRVALKVLPLAGVLDPRQLQRFRNEAQAAACLHHTGIVPVYFVGCERGVHFYAMQFIDGRPLSDLVRQLRQAEEKKRPGSPRRDEAPASEGRTEEYQVLPGEETPAGATMQAAGNDTFLTGEGRRGRGYFRRVAELGAQAAEALDHAHQLGVVHRDVKPANLLLDGGGRLWVTDFGLAQVQHGEASLTLTGDLVGTLRYMSPEQALAKRVVVDHRTDVYSLGATLYELLTLRPAFPGTDRQELLRQIAFEEPRPPRRIDRSVPVELETVVLKALEKNPNDRYATAQELADDLRRWLEDRPIRARRPSLRQVAGRWARRHRAAVWAAAAVALVAAALVGGTWLWWAQKRLGAEVEARGALQEAARLLRQERWPEALSAVGRAAGALSGVGADPGLRRQAEELRKDLEMAQRLQEAHLRGTEVKDGHFDYEGAMEAYARAFREYGLDADSLGPQEAGERIRARPVHRQLVEALDRWALAGRETGGGAWPAAAARAADPDGWRDRVRDAWARKDGQAVDGLLTSAPAEGWSSVMGLALSTRPLKELATGGRAIRLLRRAQELRPDDFWANHELAFHLENSRPPLLEEATRYYTVAVALRPQSPGARLNLARVLKERGDLDGAIAHYQAAIRLKADYAEAHNNLGNALQTKGLLDEAVAEFREALRLKADFPEAHCNLGNALRDKGLLDEAVAESRAAIRLKGDFYGGHLCLGNALLDKGLLDEAAAEFREALRLKGDYPEAHINLGLALHSKGLLDEAVAEIREAIRLKGDFPPAYYNLGNVLYSKGLPDEAAAEFRAAIRLKGDYAEAHLGLGNALRDKGLLDEALAEFRTAIRLKADYPEAHCNLGNALLRLGRFHDAAKAIRRGHELGSRKPGWRYPSDQWLRGAEQMAELDDRLSAVLEGKARPKDAAERIAFAQFCQTYRKRYAAAARFFAEAFAAQPALAEGPGAGHWYNAACAAALAGCGQGQDVAGLDDKGRARLRKQSLDWLHADVGAWRQRLEKGPDKAGPAVAKQMQHWLGDADFAGVRGAAALAKLPEAERLQWQQLWEEVEALRRRAAGPARPPADARPQGAEGLPRKR
jgi:eukaryotic-like serine/threonine-protein kinase